MLKRSRPNVSLARALSKLGVTSRTLARKMVLSGRVTVNGRTLTNPETRVHPERDKIALNGKVVVRVERHYFMLNKPVGVVTTRSDEKGRPTVYGLLKDRGSWLFPVGRLDKDSQGLLFLTNDTRWANALTDPSSRIEKVYEVRLDRKMEDQDLERFQSGLTLDDGTRTRPARIKRLSRTTGSWVEVAITEGKNRQVRRMMTTLGYETLELVRTRIGPVALANLREGETRPLTQAEVRALSPDSFTPRSP